MFWLFWPNNGVHLKHFDGVDGEAFAAFVADELFVLTALDAGALARGQSDDAFLTGQIFWQRTRTALAAGFLPVSLRGERRCRLVR
jgi:hypothetical protein